MCLKKRTNLAELSYSQFFTEVARTTERRGRITLVLSMPHDPYYWVRYWAKNRGATSEHGKKRAVLWRA